jgi:TolA-binding protein
VNKLLAMLLVALLAAGCSAPGKPEPEQDKSRPPAVQQFTEKPVKKVKPEEITENNAHLSLKQLEKEIADAERRAQPRD